jgi:hypothetical protein
MPSLSQLRRLLVREWRQMLNHVLGVVRRTVHFLVAIVFTVLSQDEVVNVECEIELRYVRLPHQTSDCEWSFLRVSISLNK